MSKFKRILDQILIFFIPSRMKRVKFLKKRGHFKKVGDRVMINSYKIPLYPNLISIGSNVWIASDVTFITHDVIHYMLNGIDKNQKFTEMIGCINIEDNVFIGNGTKILYGVNIGKNTIISAGSVVTKDLEPNGIYGGIPARKIGDFDTFYNKRIFIENNLNKSIKENHKSGVVTEEESEILWKEFFEKRS